jgi:hypothetical protein
VPNLNRADARALIPQTNLPDQQIDMVILLVRGWLLDATELDALPDPLPEWLWAAAVELAALLASNPESLAQKTVGPTSRSWPMSSRRDQIIGRVRRKYRSLRLAPQGSYPDAPGYPEPVSYPNFVTGETGGWFWIGPR